MPAPVSIAARPPSRAPAREQTRARSPDETGYIERDGLNVFWERYGDGEPTTLFLPTWTIIHSRCWKAQIPLFRPSLPSVHIRPPRKRSLRPASRARSVRAAEFAADAVAVLDQTGTESAWVVVCLSTGAPRALLLAAEEPERVQGLVFIGPACR